MLNLKNRQQGEMMKSKFKNQQISVNGFGIGLAVTGLFKLMWNKVMPEVFGVKKVTYWQSILLVLIAKALFGAASYIKDSFNFGNDNNNISNVGGSDAEEEAEESTSEENCCCSDEGSDECCPTEEVEVEEDCGCCCSDEETEEPKEENAETELDKEATPENDVDTKEEEI